jgi:hypothetical protein
VHVQAEHVRAAQEALPQHRPEVPRMASAEVPQDELSQPGERRVS